MPYTQARVFESLGRKTEKPAWNRNAKSRPRRIVGLVNDNADLESGRAALEAAIHIANEEAAKWKKNSWHLRLFLHQCVTWMPWQWKPLLMVYLQVSRPSHRTVGGA